VTDSCPFWTAEFVVAFGVGEAEEVLVKRPNDEIRRLGSRNPPSSSETTSSCQAFLGSLVLRLWTLLLKLSIALCAKDWPPVVVEPEVPDQVDPFSSGWT